MTDRTRAMTDLEQALCDTVLATDGVARLFPVDPAWQVAIKGGLARATGQATAAPVLEVQTRGRGPLVRLRIGVTGAIPTPAVARAVSARLRRQLSEAFPGQKPAIALQICAIGSDS